MDWILGGLKMRSFFSEKLVIIFLFTLSVLFLFGLIGARWKGEEVSPLVSLLPENKLWKQSESPQSYLPETLYGYIDGAAEIYLSYDFKELLVGQYKKEGSLASLTIEIYDMGEGKNSFGIYSAERFPGSNFISVGNQGYWEGESLNFIVGKYYLKLLCYDCGEDSENSLKLFSQEISNKVKEKGSLPPLLERFPREGLVPNSERFILRNFLGMSFLHNGYVADYRLKDAEFECFFAEGKAEEEAEGMLRQYLDFYARMGNPAQKISLGFHLKDRNLKHIYLARVGNFLCGVKGIKEGFERIGEKHLEFLVRSFKK